MKRVAEFAAIVIVPIAIVVGLFILAGGTEVAQADQYKAIPAVSTPTRHIVSNHQYTVEFQMIPEGTPLYATIAISNYDSEPHYYEAKMENYNVSMVVQPGKTGIQAMPIYPSNFKTTVQQPEGRANYLWNVTVTGY